MAKRTKADEALERGAELAEQAVQETERAARGAFEEAGARAAAAAESADAAARVGADFAEVAQGAAQEWLSYAQGAALRNVQAMSDMARCRTVGELMQAQAGRMADEMALFMTASRRISERLLDVAEEARDEARGRV